MITCCSHVSHIQKTNNNNNNRNNIKRKKIMEKHKMAHEGRALWLFCRNVFNVHNQLQFSPNGRKQEREKNEEKK